MQFGTDDVAHALVRNATFVEAGDSGYCGADPLVRAGRPRPALLSKNQALANKPARGPAADEGVRPTTIQVGGIEKTRWHGALVRAASACRRLVLAGCPSPTSGRDESRHRASSDHLSEIRGYISGVGKTPDGGGAKRCVSVWKSLPINHDLPADAPKVRFQSGDLIEPGFQVLLR